MLRRLLLLLSPSLCSRPMLLLARPASSAARHRQRPAREVELEEQVVFEAYRDLIRLKCLGLSGGWLGGRLGGWGGHTGLLWPEQRACEMADVRGQHHAVVQATAERHASGLPANTSCVNRSCQPLCPPSPPAEKQGLRHAEQENVAIRAHDRTTAVAALEQVKGPKPLPSQHAVFAAVPAGTGAFAAVGFSYGGGGAGDGGGGAGAEDGGGSAEEEEEDEEDSDDDDVPATAGKLCCVLCAVLSAVLCRAVLCRLLCCVAVCSAAYSPSLLLSFTVFRSPPLAAPLPAPARPSPHSSLSPPSIMHRRGSGHGPLCPA